jgi:PAS domain S-box-containing protein
LRIIRRDGRVRWVHAQHEVHFSRSAKPRRALGVLQDVTDDQEALQSELSFRDSYRALVQAVGALGSVVWVTRADPFIVQIVNELPGHEPSAYIGDAWKSLIHPDDLEPTMKAWSHAIQTSSLHAVEQRLRRPDGEWRWFRVRALPILNGDGSVRGCIGVSLDIHEERDWSARSRGQSTLTGAQIRGARGVLNWSVRDLADRAGVSPAIIRRLEERDDAPPDPDSAMASIKTALENGGIEFLFPPMGKPGIRPL